MWLMFNSSPAEVPVHAPQPTRTRASRQRQYGALVCVPTLLCQDAGRGTLAALREPVCQVPAAGWAVCRPLAYDGGADVFLTTAGGGSYAEWEQVLRAARPHGWPPIVGVGGQPCSQPPSTLRSAAPARQARCSPVPPPLTSSLRQRGTTLRRDQAAIASAVGSPTTPQAHHCRQIARQMNRFNARNASRLVFPSLIRRARYARAGG